MSKIIFESKNAEVAKLVIHQLPAHRTTRIAKAIRDGNSTFMLSESGRVYTDLRVNRSGIRALRRQSVSSLYPLRACVTLGALSQVDYDEHENVVKERSIARDADRALTEIQSISEDYKLKIPKAWVKKLTNLSAS